MFLSDVGGVFIWGIYLCFGLGLLNFIKCVNVKSDKIIKNLFIGFFNYYR